MIYRLEEMFPHDIQERLQITPFLVQSLGTIEWHSHHLPVGLDGIVGAGLAAEMADRLDAVLAPVSYIAVGGVPFPYTLELGADVVEPLYLALLREYGRMGFRFVLLLTGHFGLAQTLTIKRAALRVMEESDLLVLPLAEYDLTTDSGYTGDHAGTGETSLLWSLRPDLIRLDAVAADTPLEGVLGPDPRGQASAERGTALRAQIADRAAEMAQRLWSADPVTRRHYQSALAAGVRVLAQTQAERDARPKSTVPSIGTPAYHRHLQALYQGDYLAAKRFAEEKLADLRA